VSVFKTQALKQLTDQQVRFAPPARRAEQLSRAEGLLGEIEFQRHYPYSFVCFRVTDYRPETFADLLISGADLVHDLCLFIEALGKKTPAVPVEEVPEPVLTMTEVSKQFNVSTKTVTRWRQQGLVGGRRFMLAGRAQVGFVKSVVDRFLATNTARIERGSRFSQLTENEKEEILRRAKRLARVGGGTLTEVSRRIARRLGRSPETVRYTIKNYDRLHPAHALFPSVTGPLDEDAKTTIYSSYRRGISVEALARRFRRTRTSMYRVINEVRAQRLLAQPLDYIPHASFEDPSLEAEIVAPMPEAEEYEAKRSAMKVPKDVPPELAPLYEVPLLNKQQEQHLFRKMNFFKFKASQLRKQLCKDDDSSELDPTKVRIQDLKRIEELQAQANEVKDLLINGNMRLVVSIAKKHAAKSDNFWELLSDGNMSLLRAVEKFDFSRGFKFSTYASWAIMKNFARSIPDEMHRRERYVTGHEDLFESAVDTRTHEQEVLPSVEQKTQQVTRLLESLAPRERQIIRMRAGLDGGRKPMTLEEIGNEMHITKERVRQLHVRIMKKLRDIAEEQHMEIS